jgi:hypothetical protein
MPFVTGTSHVTLPLEIFNTRRSESTWQRRRRSVVQRRRCSVMQTRRDDLTLSNLSPVFTKAPSMAFAPMDFTRSMNDAGMSS